MPSDTISGVLTVVLKLLICVRKLNQPGTHMFLTHRKTPWNRCNLSLRLRRARKVAGVADDAKLYGLRHGFGTRAVLNTLLSGSRVPRSSAGPRTVGSWTVSTTHGLRRPFSFWNSRSNRTSQVPCSRARTVRLWNDSVFSAWCRCATPRTSGRRRATAGGSSR